LIIYKFYFYYPIQSVLPKNANGIFSLSIPITQAQDVFLLLRVEKVLQGLNDDVTEPYIKFEGIKDKEKEKLISQIENITNKQSYWQPFVWSIAPLLNEDNTIPDSITFKPLYRTKDQDLSDEAVFSSHSENKVCKKKNPKYPAKINPVFILNLNFYL
jgi:hypothetical protein